MLSQLIIEAFTGDPEKCKVLFISRQVICVCANANDKRLMRCQYFDQDRGAEMLKKVFMVEINHLQDYSACAGGSGRD
jgi:hypothetical protein